MVLISYDVYDKILATLGESITSPGDYVPTHEEVDKYFLPNLDDKDKVLFLLWIDAECDRTPENAERLKYISSIIKEKIKFVDRLPADKK